MSNRTFSGHFLKCAECGQTIPFADAADCMFCASCKIRLEADDTDNQLMLNAIDDADGYLSAEASAFLESEDL